MRINGNQCVFDRYAREYDRWYDKNRFAYLSEIEALKRVVPGTGRGLEIGVGTGRFAGKLGIARGIDPSESMLKIARERGIRTVRGEGENLPFMDKVFDFIVMVITLCFVSNPDRVMAESRRVLRDNGKLILGIVDRNSRLGRSYLEKKRRGRRFYGEAAFFSAGEVLDLMKKHGFADIAAFQTLSGPVEGMRSIEQPRRGYGEGGFVVMAGRKRRFPR